MLRQKKVYANAEEIKEHLRHIAYDLKFDILEVNHRADGVYIIDVDTDGYVGRPEIPAIKEALA
jgi:hypothetical protein